MNEKNKDIKFGKSITDNDVTIKKIEDSKQKKEKIKEKIIEKYNLSAEDAENIIKKLESQRNLEKIPKSGKNTNIKKKPSKKEGFPPEQKLKKNNATPITTPQPINQNIKTNPQKEKQHVDSIISTIIPEYKQEISIELKNVNLTFEVVPDKIDTLKETFIRSIKGNKSKKIKLHVLKDISFKIYRGEKIGIIGYNGAGKSTLLNLITGIYPPDTGTVNTYGNISPLLSLGAGFDYNYSGRKNIYLNGAVLGYDKKFLQEKEKDIIEFSELGDYIDLPIKNYSSGMLAKLGFSIATLLEPDILIIDEILGVGDTRFQKKSGDKIRSMIDTGTTVLLVSHSIPQIRELCDKAIWIDEGQIRGIGEVNQVCDEYIKDSEKASTKQLANIKFR